MTISSASTASTKAIDLAWVEFSEEEAEPCAIPGCSMEAVWVGEWRATCTCWADEYYYCDPHGIKFQPNVGIRKLCVDCLAPIMLVSLERIPR